MPKEEKCKGWYYNFKTAKVEHCIHVATCPFAQKEALPEDFIHSNIRAFRKCNKNPRVTAGNCRCGKMLYACFASDGRRLGVTHLDNDEEHHSRYFSFENHTLESELAHRTQNN